MLTTFLSLTVIYYIPYVASQSFFSLSGLCFSKSINVTLISGERFRGVIFSEPFRDCSKTGNGISSVIHLTIDEDCAGTRALFERDNEVIKVKIYVQRDPLLLQANDEIFQVTCSPEWNTEAMVQYISRKFVQEDVQVQKDTQKVLAKNFLIPNENVIGQEVNFIQGWMDLLPVNPVKGVPELTDEHLIVGQNVSLILRWKQPLTRELKMGSCSALGSATTLQLTDGSGCPIVDFFPKFSIKKREHDNVVLASSSSAFPIFKFRDSDVITFRCELIEGKQSTTECLSPNDFKGAIIVHVFETKVSVKKLRTSATVVDAVKPNNYLRSAGLSAQHISPESDEYENDLDEDKSLMICMRPTRIFLAFGVLLFALFLALIFTCMLWNRARKYTQRRQPHLQPQRVRSFPYLLPRPFVKVIQ